jgi:hypothetical protein
MITAAGTVTAAFGRAVALPHIVRRLGGEKQRQLGRNRIQLQGEQSQQLHGNNQICAQ